MYLLKGLIFALDLTTSWKQKLKYDITKSIGDFGSRSFLWFKRWLLSDVDQIALILIDRAF